MISANEAQQLTDRKFDSGVEQAMIKVETAIKAAIGDRKYTVSLYDCKRDLIPMVKSKLESLGYGVSVNKATSQLDNTDTIVIYWGV